MRTVLFILFLGFSMQLLSQDLYYTREQATLLSSDEMSGRGYVNDGLFRAASHIAKEYESMGLAHFNKDYYQPFYHAVNTFPGEMELSIEGEILRPGGDYIVDPASPSSQGLYRAKVFDGNNLRALPNPLEFSESCSDCVLVLDMGSVEDRKTIKEAQQLKYMFSSFAPVIWASWDKLTWGVADRQLEFPVIEMQPNKIVEGSFVGINMEANLKEDFLSMNVAGYVEGTQFPDSFVVFTAHYDHLGMMGQEACFNGANDNASGTAFIMSLAQHYQKNPAPYTTVFVAFAGEEAGLVGSHHFVQNSPVDLQAIKFLINLDLMGSGIDGITVVNAVKNQNEFDLITEINQDHNYLPKVKSRGQAANSDHYYFAEAGVPAIFIYAMGGSKAYHDIFDVSSNLSFDEYSDIFKLLTELVTKL